MMAKLPDFLGGDFIPHIEIIFKGQNLSITLKTSGKVAFHWLVDVIPSLP